MTYHVAVIGAGICGCCIAQQLAQYRLSVCIIEKENDVSCGASKANSGIIHAGYDPKPGTLAARFNREGAALYPELARSLSFDYCQTGSLVLAFTPQQLHVLHELYERGRANGVPSLELLSAASACAREPNIAKNITGALYAPTAAVISPYQAVWAVAEHAVQNGAELRLGTRVLGISRTENAFCITTGRGVIEARYIVNAAGLYADVINDMAGARRFVIRPRRGEYAVFDSSCAGLVRSVIFQAPGPMGKGVLVAPTVDGNILAGPNAFDGGDKTDTDTTCTGQRSVLDAAKRSVPALNEKDIITSFAGNRAIPYLYDSKTQTETQLHDFIIEEDEAVPRFITVAGIASPGLTAAPAIARYVVQLLERTGLPLIPTDKYIPQRRGIPSFKKADDAQRRKLIAQDPRYARICCRCELITEAKIAAAINSTVGARDLDGIKRRVRSGMGRCQGGFCTPRAAEILARKLHTDLSAVTKRADNSFILDSPTRILDTGAGS